MNRVSDSIHGARSAQEIMNRQNGSNHDSLLSNHYIADE
jgi:hypothetical protein